MIIELDRWKYLLLIIFCAGHLAKISVTSVSYSTLPRGDSMSGPISTGSGFRFGINTIDGVYVCYSLT